MPTTPSTNTYNRLENLPFANNSERSLRAEVRDGLWMLARQWQFGEFEAEDVGSAILARISSQITPLNRYLASHTAAAAVGINSETPLEVMVEREMPPLDLMMRIEMGRHFIRLLRKGVADNVKFNACLDRFLTATVPRKLRLSLPTENSESAYLYSNRRLRQAAALIAGGKCIDGGLLYEYLAASTVNKASKFLAAPDLLVDAVGDQYVGWFKRVYSQPNSGEAPAYQADSLEYKFALSVSKWTTESTTIRAEGYPGGHLDWYDFDLDSNSEAKLNPMLSEIPNRNTKVTSVIPSEVQFAGMPKARWWEFEDGRVNLYGSSADAVNPATLIYNEFALVYSNDWMIVPFTLPSGCLVGVQNIVVTDTFGQRIKIVAAGSESPDEYKKWNLFSLKQAGTAVTGPDYRLLLPQVLDHVQEGKPFESVNFIRDEMANIVWGVEDVVPDGLGGAMRGHEAGLQHLQYLQGFASTSPSTLVANDAVVRYQLGTTVPQHWIPFVAVKAPFNNREIRLQRSSMPLVLDGDLKVRVSPRTGILSQPPSPYYVNEEEVPRAGALVTRVWQRTRWFNGQTYTWVGRQKQAGRGEGSSGLAFDQILKKDKG